MYYGDMFDMHHRNRKPSRPWRFPSLWAFVAGFAIHMGFGIFATLLFTFFLFGGNPHHFWWGVFCWDGFKPPFWAFVAGGLFVGGGFSVYLEFEHPGPDHRDAMQVSKDALFLWGYGLGWILNHPNLQGPPRPGGPREAHY